MTVYVPSPSSRPLLDFAGLGFPQDQGGWGEERGEGGEGKAELQRGGVVDGWGTL